MGWDLNSSLLALEVMKSRELSVILLLNIQFHKFRTVTCIAKCNSQRRVTWGRMSRPNEREKQSQWLPRIRTAGLSGPNKTEMLRAGRGQDFNRRQSSSTFRVRQGTPDA